jgi:hypothetical protein
MVCSEEGNKHIKPEGIKAEFTGYWNRTGWSWQANWDFPSGLLPVTGLGFFCELVNW